MDTIDTKHTDYPICPNCEHEELDAREIRAFDMESFDVDCGKCGTTYIATRHLDISYSSKEKS